MCLVEIVQIIKNRKKKNNQKVKKKKIYPENKYNEVIIEDYNKIKCHGCNMSFDLEEIKINCAGCDRFFHCCIAGKCVGEKCKNQKTILGETHQLSWCILCVPGIERNRVGGKECICHECYQSSK